MTTRGIRNNNPGNIDRTRDHWKGMSVDQSGDDRFVVFDYPVWGIRALARILVKDMEEGDTLRKMINEWAPPVENNTSAYVDAVAKHVGVDPDTVVGRSYLPKIIEAIIQHENGVQPYSSEIIAKGIELERAS